MKKLIAILMVLAIVAGFAFAADPAAEAHELKVKTIVGEKLPAFQLRFTGKTIVTTNNVDSVSETSSTVKTNDTGVAFTDGATRPEETVMYVGFDLGIAGDHKATFYAWLVKNSDGYWAKTNKPFKLTFGDGVFTGLKSHGAALGDGTLTPKSIVAAASATSYAGIDSLTATGDHVDLAFNGESCPEAETEVASAVYTWVGQPTLDMGSYQANIQLTVTQE